MSQNQNTEDAMHTPEGYTNKPPVHNGPVLSLLVIILVLIFGGLYLWGGMLKTQENVEVTPIVNNEPETPRADADVQILGTLSPSDEIEAIEADINNTDVGSLSTDLTAIDAEAETFFAQ